MSPLSTAKGCGLVVAALRSLLLLRSLVWGLAWAPWELKVEFHEEAILEVERQAAAAETVEKRVQDVEILLGGLLNDLQTISLEAECAVNWAEEGSAAELDRACSGFLGDFALLKVWVGEATSVQSDTEALRVLAGRATNLEQWGDEFAASCKEVKDRVEYLGAVERRMHRRPRLFSVERGAKLASDDTKFGSY